MPVLHDTTQIKAPQKLPKHVLPESNRIRHGHQDNLGIQRSLLLQFEQSKYFFAIIPENSSSTHWQCTWDGHPLLAKRVIELKDFANQPFVSLSSNDPYRVLIDETFARAGIARHQMIETPTAVSLCSFVRQGLGLAIVNPLTALDFVGHNLHIRPLAVSLPFRVSVIHPEHRPSHPLAGAFLEALQSEAAALRLQLNDHTKRKQS